MAFEISCTSYISKPKSPKCVTRFTSLIIRKCLSSLTVNFDLDACISRVVNDFILGRSHMCTHFTDLEA